MEIIELHHQKLPGMSKTKTTLIVSIEQDEYQHICYLLEKDKIENKDIQPIEHLYNTKVESGVIFNYIGRTLKAIKKLTIKDVKGNEEKERIIEAAQLHKMEVWLCEDVETHERLNVPVSKENYKDDNTTE